MTPAVRPLGPMGPLGSPGLVGACPVAVRAVCVYKVRDGVGYLPIVTHGSAARGLALAEVQSQSIG